MTAAQQPKEYIIMEDELEQLVNEDYANDLVIDTCVRSRPHPPAPAEVVYRCCEYYEAPRLGKPEECRMATEAARASTLKARAEILDEPHVNQYIERIRKASKAINTEYPLKNIISVSLLIAAEHYESLRRQKVGE